MADTNDGTALPDATRHYIGGVWTAPHGDARRQLIDPSTQTPIGDVALGDGVDVDKAVSAAAAAFPAFAASSVDDRLSLLQSINDRLEARNDDLARAISAEMGAPKRWSAGAQAPRGVQHFSETIRVLKEFQFEEKIGSTILRHEPIGVCALITPWNWPINQVAAKVAPALAAGCTVVLKPSELAPLAAVILAEIIDDVGVPPGVFNMVHGDGEGVGAPLTGHPDVDMVSFTGSTRAGVAISKNAAPTIKRVALELGGKSANVVLPGADFEKAIPAGVKTMMMNSGQSCNAPSRMFVPASRYEDAARLARGAAEKITVGPADSEAMIGPIANKAQYERVLGYLEKGLAEGAELIAGGPGAPDGLDAGYFVRPTVFGKVTPEMTIAKEEIFGPVLSILTYDDVDDVVALANDTEYGLSGQVWGADRDEALDVARRLRTGMVHLNGAPADPAAPFGGYKQSGNGREWGEYGLHEYLEVKSLFGAA